MTIETAVDTAAGQLDAIAAVRLDALERALAALGCDADVIADLRAAFVADFVVAKFEALEQLEAWLRTTARSPA